MKALRLTILVFLCTWIPQAAHATCDDETTRAEVKLFNEAMTIAMARGDVVYMTEQYHRIYGDEHAPGLLFSCLNDSEVSSNLFSTCGFECFDHLIRYQLFMANDLAYYSSVANDQIGATLTPDEVMAHAETGLGLLEIANKVLPLADSGEGDFRQFLIKRARFNLLQVRLYMSAGDSHYQATSEFSLQRLAYLIDESTDPTGDGAASIPTLGDAGVLYEKAFGALGEALMEIPDDDTFAGVRTEATTLEYEMKRRLDSVAKGYLFLNIDPEDFSVFSVAKLEARLGEMAANILMLEERVETLMREWLHSQQGQQTQEVDERRRVNDTSISLSAYRIAKLEGMAAEYATTIQQAKAEMTQEASRFDTVRQLHQLKFALRSKLLELSHRIDLVEQKKEEDILNFESLEVNTQIGDLRWLMGWEVTKSNLTLQIAAIEAELVQYGRELERNGNRAQQYALEVDSTEKQIAIHRNNITEAGNQLQLIEQQQQQEFPEVRHRFEVEICATEADLAFLGASLLHPYVRDSNDPWSCDNPEVAQSQTLYLETLCGSAEAPGLRERMANHGIDSAMLLLKCLVGDNPAVTIPQIVGDDIERAYEQYGVDIAAVDCPVTGNVDVNGEPILLGSHLEMIEAVFAKEQRLAAEELTDLSERIIKINELIDTVRDDWVWQLAVREGAVGAIALIEAAYKVAVSLPKKTAKTEVVIGSLAGPTGGAISLNTTALMEEFDPAGSLGAALNAARWLAQEAGDFMGRRAAYNERVAQLEMSLQQAQDQLDRGRLENHVRRAHAAKALAEIMGQAMTQHRDLQRLLLEKETVTIDCANQVETLAHNIQASQSTHERLLSELRLAAQRNDQMRFAKDTEERLISSENLGIEMAELRVRQLQMEMDGIGRDSDLLRELVAGAEQRKADVEGLRLELANLEDEHSAKVAARTRVEAARDELQQAVNETEWTYLQNAIDEEGTQTEVLLGEIESLGELRSQMDGLDAQMYAYRGEILQKVEGERVRIFERLQENVGTAGEKQRLFMANQERLGTLIKGVPAFVQNKRRGLEAANRYLNLLGNRARTLTSLAGEGVYPRVNGSAYVRTYDDLAATAERILESVEWSEAQVKTQVSRIVIPGSSGLARELALNKKAAFEISPFAQGNMDELGYYSLWHDSFAPGNGFSEKLMLLDMLVLVTLDDSDCLPMLYRVLHNGSGYVFQRLSEDDPSVVARFLSLPMRVAEPHYLNATNAVSNSEIDEFVSYWSTTFWLHDFPPAHYPPPNDPSAALPLMGLPLLGRYTLAFPDNAGDSCNYNGGTIAVYFAYAMR